MNKKINNILSIKNDRRRVSVSTGKAPPADKYTFQSDDEDHQTKPVFVRKKSRFGENVSRGRVN